jgi:hypothetical protein
MGCCEREYDMYPSNVARQLLERLYSKFLEFCRQAIGSTQSETLRLRDPITDDTFKASITRIRRISSNVTREIELHHRLELKWLIGA